MKHYLLTPVLALMALAVVGCSSSDAPIRAAAPASVDYSQTNTVATSGKYALYHVTKLDMWGAPVTAEKITTLNLQANDRLGFEYVIPTEKQYNPDTQADVWAYAGSFRQKLGPIQTMSEKYFWANPDDWDHYWSNQSERMLYRRAILN